jgi:arylsulfatase A-like enzyme
MNEFENTLIVFLSDNGASAEIMVRADGHDPQAPPGSASSYLCLGPGWSNMCNTPFRRHKTWLHEGGACTPFIVHWPNGIRARGELRHTHAHVIDIVPTILEMTNVSSNPVYPMPGQSLKSIFKNDSKWEHPLWWYHEGNRAYREGNWKIVAARDEDWELFNIDKDRTESNNLADSNPAKVDELERKWNKLLQDFQKITASNKLENKKITHKTGN